MIGISPGKGNAMTSTNANADIHINDWHRNLLTVATIFTILLVAMGGVLCVTQSIKSCPDWPGCFGKLFPPLETSPILEYTHRILAASSGLLILSAAIAGLVRTRRLRWILVPPLIACVLVVEVSLFGAMVVLRGITPGWAAVDLGSALLVVALMVTSCVIAHARKNHPTMADQIKFNNPFAKLVLATVAVAYGVLLSGVLVAGKNSITACLGWPIYSPQLIQTNSHGVGNIFRLTLSAIGIFLIMMMLMQIWRNRLIMPAVFRIARWVLAVFVLEILIQVLLVAIGFEISLLVAYTVTAAIFWSLLVALGISTGIDLSSQGYQQ